MKKSEYIRWAAKVDDLSSQAEYALAQLMNAVNSVEWYADVEGDAASEYCEIVSGLIDSLQTLTIPARLTKKNRD